MTHSTPYDVIIIGAGPAGLSCGRVLLEAKCTNVLILDKIAPWEHPIPCAEGVGKLGFHEAIPVDPSWIRQHISSATFHSPNGSTISYTDKHGGYIIDREHMQKDLAAKLISGGMVGDFSCKVKSISAETGDYRSVTTVAGEVFSGRIIIDASGPTNRFGRTEHIAAQPVDLEPAYFAWVEGYDIAPDHIHIFAGQRLAPGGYAWIFPRGTGGANIGIVVGRSRKESINIKNMLNDFLRNYCPTVKVIRHFAGSIPCGYKKSLPIALPGLIKTGDAASTVNPISRAGISEALLSGRLAGDTVLSMLRAPTRKGQLRCAKLYERTWNTHRGYRHMKLAKVKTSLRSIPDDDYNNGAEALSAIPAEEITMSKIFKASLSRFPRLMWAMRHLM